MRLLIIMQLYTPKIEHNNDNNNKLFLFNWMKLIILAA